MNKISKVFYIYLHLQILMHECATRMCTYRNRNVKIGNLFCLLQFFNILHILFALDRGLLGHLSQQYLICNAFCLFWPFVSVFDAQIAWASSPCINMYNFHLHSTMFALREIRSETSNALDMVQHSIFSLFLALHVSFSISAWSKLPLLYIFNKISIEKLS